MKLLKALLFFLLIPAAVLLYIPLLLAYLGFTNPSPQIWFYPLAIVFWLGGGAMCIATIVAFWRNGQGTPAPNAPTETLVVSGLYGFTRNPMYVGAWIVVSGYVFWFQSPAYIMYLLLVWLLFQGAIVFYEEPHLRKQFGPAYDEYSSRVPRWLFRSR